jgi:hypothetical protein
MFEIDHVWIYFKEIKNLLSRWGEKNLFPQPKQVQNIKGAVDQRQARQLPLANTGSTLAGLL